ncbi:hypothetical protein GQ44DRAFT_609609 [Phaeosphaeriaceae sp. PMI808]|nr:hypothetical protein GQ44DRAFT_609609 [Phaeosphaeriaceae sp. PMI808]
MISILLSTAILFTSVIAHCTQLQLITAVDSYIFAQLTGNNTAFKARFDNSTWLGYYENSVKLDIDAGIVSTPLPIKWQRSMYDTTACATYSEVIVNSTTSTPYVIGTQLRFANHKINKVDSIVTKPGDWLFNITGYAHYSPLENWGWINSSARDTRETIKAAADAYLDLFNNPNVTVPWGIPCVRLEGGMYGDDGPNGTCANYIPKGVPITRRRYVIYEEYGSVDVMVDFGKSAWPDSHQFRVEEGKLRYVHTLTHCGVTNCGVGNGTAFGRL